MTPITHPEVVRATQELTLISCKHVGANYIWWFSDHLEVGSGSFYIDQTQIQMNDVRRYDACFAEIGKPDGLPLPYIHNPNNTYIHHIMILSNVVAGKNGRFKITRIPRESLWECHQCATAHFLAQAISQSLTLSVLIAQL